MCVFLRRNQLVMLLLTLPWCTLLQLLISSLASAVPTETFLLLSEGEERRLEIGQTLVAEISEQAEAGDFFHLVSTPSHEHVATLEVPVGAKAARLKRRSLVKELQELKSWLQRGPPGNSRQIRLYGLPETIANLRKHPHSQCRVVIVGTPVFMDEHYAGLNMIGENGSALVPLDGWLLPGTDSPFAPSHTSLPEGTRATWITTSSLWGPTGSKEHRQGIIRFYRLWFESQNSSLLSRFSSSPGKAFDFTPDAGFVRLHLRQEPAQMRQVNDATALMATARARARRVRVIPEPQRETEDKRSFLPGLCWQEFLTKHHRQAEKIQIIRLRYVQDESPDTATDVDLYLVDNATGKEIWFENPRVTGLGRLYNDVRIGSAISADGEPILQDNFEFICIEPDRELTGCTLWVNKYVGVGEVVCEVSLLVDGEQVGAKRSTFDTPAGDLGTQADNRAASRNWMKIDLDELKSE